MNQLDLACSHFRTLLEEQLQRIENMNQEKTDFSKKDRVVIGLIDGDGIGPIIMQQAKRVLDLLLAEEVADGKVVLKQIYGLDIENRLALNQPVPPAVLAGSAR